MDTPDPKPDESSDPQVKVNESPEPQPKMLKGLEPWAKVLALATTLSWMLLFGYGLIIDTKAPRVIITRSVFAMADTTLATPSGSETAKTDTTTLIIDMKTPGVITARSVFARADTTSATPSGSETTKTDTTTAAVAGAQTDAPEEHEDATAATLFFLGIVVFLFYTPTNLALLCMLAGLMGALGRRARLHPMGNLNKPKQPHAEQEDDLPFDAINPYLSGIIRGFFVYLILISGALFLFGNSFTQTTADGYARLAGMLSLLSFVMSYNPLIYGSVFMKIDHYLDKKLKDTRPKNDSEKVSGAADSGMNGQIKPADKSLKRHTYAPDGKASRMPPKLRQRQAEKTKNT